MRLSSIFSFSTLRVRWRVPVGILAWLLILMAAGEVAMRVPALTGRLPRPELTLWHATNVQAKLDAVQGLQATRGVDVLFIGNSTVLAGMDPAVFDAARGRSGDSGPVSYNGALEGIPATGALTFTRVYLRYVHPSTIVYGVTPQDLNSDAPATRDIAKRVKEAPLVQAETGSDVQSFLLRALLDHSQLFRYRLVLRELLLRGGGFRDTTLYFDDRGFESSEARLSDVPESGRGAYLNNAGVRNYAARGEQMAALNDLAKLCQSEGIQLVLINMPLSAGYFSNFDSPNDYPAYVAALKGAAAAWGLTLWDMQSLPQNAAFGDASFADLNHLNRYGAADLSQMMGRRYAQLAGAQALRKP